MSDDPKTPNQPIRRFSNPPPLKRSFTMDSVNYQAGDFIKPDPAMTRQETRKYIRNELQICLTERLTTDDESTSLNDSHLFYQSNPRERLYYVGQLLEELNIEESPGNVAYTILEKHLNRETIDYDKYPVKLVQLVMGFIHTDRLPCERTIFSFWNHSPFKALRNAPPLTDEEENTDASTDDDFKDVLPFPLAFVNGEVVIRLSATSVAISLGFVTLWIAMVVAQLGPIRTVFACM